MIQQYVRTVLIVSILSFQSEKTLRFEVFCLYFETMSYALFDAKNEYAGRFLEDLKKINHRCEAAFQKFKLKGMKKFVKKARKR